MGCHRCVRYVKLPKHALSTSKRMTSSAFSALQMPNKHGKFSRLTKLHEACFNGFTN